MHTSRSTAAAAAFSLIVGALFLAEPCRFTNAQQQDPQQQQRRGRGFGGFGEGVIKARVAPHWFADNTRFWYSNNLRDGAREFIVVDAVAGKREKAFDHEKLAAALSKAGDHEYLADRLPFESIEFVDGGKSFRFTVGNTDWKCNLSTYEVTTGHDSATADPKSGAQSGNIPSDAHQASSSPLDPTLDQAESPSSEQSEAEVTDDSLAAPKRKTTSPTDERGVAPVSALAALPVVAHRHRPTKSGRLWCAIPISFFVMPTAQKPN